METHLIASVYMPLCLGGGNYNPILGRCSCPVGRNGTLCEGAALPACRLRPSSNAVACATRRPQHCECVRQCLESGAFSAHIYPICFVKRNRSAASLFSDVPMLPRHDGPARATFFQDGKQLAAADALAVELRPNLVHVPHRHCRARCSERGACVAPRQLAASADRAGLDRQAFCMCDPHYKGTVCETHQTSLCWNGCLGRGSCLDGFCSCTPPFFGPGCAYGGGTTAAAAGDGGAADGVRAHASRGRFKVHVYDLDAVVLRRLHYGSDPDPIFNTYHTFLSALLADGPSLSSSADAADLLLVPAFGTNMDKLLEYYAHAADAIHRRFPSLWPSRSRAHVWLTSGDGGGCDLNRLPQLRRLNVPQLRHGVIVAHYLKLNVSGEAAASFESCGVPGKDVAIPPHVPTVERPAYLSAGLTPVLQRPTSFFFAGNAPDAKPDPAPTPAPTPTLILAPAPPPQRSLAHLARPASAS